MEEEGKGGIDIERIVFTANGGKRRARKKGRASSPFFSYYSLYPEEEKGVGEVAKRAEPAGEKGRRKIAAL